MLTPIEQKNPLKTIVAAWLLAGTLDISSAFISVYLHFGKNPLLVGNYISSAIFGRADAYAGGTPMVIIGILFHYLIAFIFTVIFFLLHPRIYAVLKNKFIAAILYGLFVWIVMNLVVVPLTRIGWHSIKLQNAIENIIILMISIGLPVSLISYNFYYGKKVVS